MLRAAKLWLFAFVLVALSGCSRSPSARCSLGEARLVTQDAVSSYDGIALVATKSGAHPRAVWSNALGLFTKSLRTNAPARKLGARCAGGIAALDHGSLLVACSQPSRGDSGAGSLRLLQVDDEKQNAMEQGRSLATLGRDARGVALAATNDALYLSYADGQVGEPRVFLLEVNGGGPPIALSTRQQNGREPALAVRDAVPFVVFAATELGPHGARHRLMISRAGQPARLLRELLFASPSPALAADGEGLVIAFRDLPRPKARTELYMAHIDAASLRLRAEARAIGRANGHAGPSLALCQRTRAVTVPIDHAGELYVAFNPLSAALETPEANHQYYESEHEFVASNTTCVAGYPLALIAERTEANVPAARLLAAEFRCTK